MNHVIRVWPFWLPNAYVGGLQIDYRIIVDDDDIETEATRRRWWVSVWGETYSMRYNIQSLLCMTSLEDGDKDGRTRSDSWTMLTYD